MEKSFVILITGCSGFVGTNVTQYFVDKGVQVVGVDIAEPKRKFAKNFTFHKCDLTDRDAVVKTFDKFNPEKVIHLAFVTIPTDNYAELTEKPSSPPRWWHDSTMTLRNCQ